MFFFVFFLVFFGVSLCFVCFFWCFFWCFLCVERYLRFFFFYFNVSLYLFLSKENKGAIEAGKSMLLFDTEARR